MAKLGFGQFQTAEQTAKAKYDGNPAGEREPGRLVKHLWWLNGKRRMCVTRYTEDLCCGVCGGKL